MISTGTSLGGFILGNKLGAGAMGTVYHAHQRSLGRDVVIKTLHPHLAEDDSLIARFTREARHAAKLAHPNTVQIIDFGFDCGIHYIAMELVDGIDLKMLLRGVGPPPLREGSLMILHLLRGLEAAHRHGVMHRDIKPANLMLTAQGAVKVMDFGLARQTSEGSTITVAGAVMGSAAYMSPEQAQGHSLDNRTDIFSAGLVAYEILSGVRAFPGDSYAVVLHNIIYDEPAPLDQVCPGVPAPLVELIQWMITKDQDTRCPEVSQARERLEGLIDRDDLAHAESILRRFYAGLGELRAAPLPPVALPPLDSTAVAASRVAATQASETRGEGPAGEAAGTGLAGTGPAGTRLAGTEGTGMGATRKIPDVEPGGHAPATSTSGAKPRTLLRWIPLGLLPVLAVAGWLSFGRDTDRPGDGELQARATLADSAATREGIPSGTPSTALPDSPSGEPEGAEHGDPQTRDPGASNPQMTNAGENDRETPDTGTRPGETRPAGTGTDAGGTRDVTRLDPRPQGDEAVFRQRYRISTRPWATVYVDNDPRPRNESGFFESELLEGLHLFRIVNEKAGIDTVMEYEVESGDQNNVLVFDVAEGSVKASRR